MQTPAEDQAGEPDWLRNWKALPPAAPSPARNEKGHYLPGQSGNSLGRTPGIPNKRSPLEAKVAQYGEQVMQKVIDAALEGDLQACGLVLQRISAPLKARAERVEFALDTSLPLHEQAAQVLQAVGQGALDPDSAQTVLACVNALISIRNADQFEARLRALEGRANAAAPRGGVIEMEDQ